MTYDPTKLDFVYRMLKAQPDVPELKAVLYVGDPTAPIILVVAEHQHLLAALVREPSTGQPIMVEVIAEEEFFRLRRHLRRTGISYPQGVRVGDCERLTLGFTCPRQWNDLQATGDKLVRHCATCAKDIHFVADALELEFRGRRGDCVAIQAEEAIYLGMPAHGYPWRQV